MARLIQSEMPYGVQLARCVICRKKSAYQRSNAPLKTLLI